MNIVRVEGKGTADILLYTLSTCVWCKKAKKWLKKKHLAYRYVDVDLEPPERKEVVMDELRRWNPKGSFPTIVVNGKDCIVGFKPERFKEVFK
jgi:glutaredoxin